jgi:hypothetical protein
MNQEHPAPRTHTQDTHIRTYIYQGIGIYNQWLKTDWGHKKKGAPLGP